MKTDPVATESAGLRVPIRVRALPAVREAGLVAVFYYVYRTLQRLGKIGGVEPRAYANAKRVVAVERFLHIFGEHAVQSAFIGMRWFIKSMNIYYGTLHFMITASIMLWLFIRRPGSYMRARNLLAATTGMALIGYYAFPLTPPRLLLCNDSIPAPGPSRLPIIGQCFVDTMDRFGGLWSYQSKAVKAMANEFAAMPSLHFAWALWCALVVIPLVRRRWVKVLWGLYPVLTLFAIVVTANHYFLDAVGGTLTLWAASGFLRWYERRQRRREAISSAA